MIDSDAYAGVARSREGRSHGLTRQKTFRDVRRAKDQLGLIGIPLRTLDETETDGETPLEAQFFKQLNYVPGCYPIIRLAFFSYKFIFYSFLDKPIGIVLCQQLVDQILREQDQ